MKGYHSNIFLGLILFSMLCFAGSHSQATQSYQAIILPSPETPGGIEVYAWDINENGIIAGYDSTVGGNVVLRWDNIPPWEWRRGKRGRRTKRR